MKDNKALVIEKKIECIIGIIFLIPPIIAVFCFLFNWFDWSSSSFVEMNRLGGEWSYHTETAYGDYGAGAGVSSSPAPIYLGLMAIAGAYMIKDSIRYLLIKNEEGKTEENVEEKC